MASDTTLMPAAETAAPEPEILTLRTQLVSAGHTKDLLAGTDHMTFHIHCYGPKGGENGLHAHVDEDHVFVVLQGAFYSFANETDEPLVMIRFGAMDKTAPGGRLDPQGQPIPGRSKQKGAKPPVFIEGEFFE